MSSLSETHDGSIMGWFCSRFAFSLDVLPIAVQAGATFGFGPKGQGISVADDPLSLLSPLQRVLSPFPPLPRTLESVGFLGASGAVHLFGSYSLLHTPVISFGTTGAGADSSASALDNSIAFTLASTSLLRVLVAPRRGTGNFFASLSLQQPNEARVGAAGIQVHAEHNDAGLDRDHAAWLLSTLVLLCSRRWFNWRFGP